MLLGEGCSSGKNTRGTRAYHELTTRYNIYFNAEKAYNGILESQTESYRDDYTTLLPFYAGKPVEEKKRTGGAFDAVVDKTSKAIREHSIIAKPRRDPSKPQSRTFKQWLQQDEFNPFIHNAWLLLGKAHLQNGDYAQAMAVFMQIQRLFKQDADLITETEIWLLRAYTETDRMPDAGNIVYLLQSKTIAPHLLDLFTGTYANYLIHKREYAESIPWLKKAIAREKYFWQKKRLQYLLGQLYELIGEKEPAYNAYEQVKSLGSPFVFTLNATIAQLFVASEAQRPKIREALRKLHDKAANDSERVIIQSALGKYPEDSVSDGKMPQTEQMPSTAGIKEENLARKAAEHDSIYQEAYRAYQKGEATQVQSTFITFTEKYPTSGLMPQMMLMHALSFAQDNEAAKTETYLLELLEKHPESDAALLAQNIVAGLSQGKVLAENASMHTQWHMQTTDKKSRNANMASFSPNRAVPHLILLTYDRNSPDKNRLLFFTADFNFTQFKLRAFDFSPIRFLDREALRIQPFLSFEDASHYLQMMRSESLFADFFAKGITPVVISVENLAILQRHSTMDAYKTFFANTFESEPPNLPPLQSTVAEDFTTSPMPGNKKGSSPNVGTSPVPASQAETSEALQLRLERKAVEAIQQKQESTANKSRNELLKEREKLRQKKIRQREQEQRKREQEREAALKLREQKREQQIQRQQRQ